ncbi:hypothetical protein BHE74_00024968 [Ensete ventricosum]|nr:hypothetical protein BHE74_00024968 [Ensete ventricosum]RZR79526.1 hypothetical protein BHM03_00005258 [Ensete ventricosum]
MFLLLARGEEVARGQRNRSLVSRAMDHVGDGSTDSRFFPLFFFLPPSVVDDRFLVVTGRKQPQSAVSLGGGQSAYRSIHIVSMVSRSTRRLGSVRQTLIGRRILHDLKIAYNASSCSYTFIDCLSLCFILQTMSITS